MSGYSINRITTNVHNSVVPPNPWLLHFFYPMSYVQECAYIRLMQRLQQG